MYWRARASLIYYFVCVMKVVSMVCGQCVDLSVRVDVRQVDGCLDID